MIVQTRFYPTSTEPGHIDPRSASAPAGTVVDRDVTQPDKWECFQQPHVALQGTSKSSHNTVICDEILVPKFRSLPAIGAVNPSDYFQLMTNSMAYTYGRATRSVSLPPPAYYADLAAERAPRWMSKYFEPSSSERGSDNGAGAAESGDVPEIELHVDLEWTMWYI